MAHNVSRCYRPKLHSSTCLKLVSTSMTFCMELAVGLRCKNGNMFASFLQLASILMLFLKHLSVWKTDSYLNFSIYFYLSIKIGLCLSPTCFHNVRMTGIFLLQFNSPTKLIVECLENKYHFRRGHSPEVIPINMVYLYDYLQFSKVYSANGRHW